MDPPMTFPKHPFHLTKVSIPAFLICVLLTVAVHAQPFQFNEIVGYGSPRSKAFKGWYHEYTFVIDINRHFQVEALSTRFEISAYLISPSGDVIESIAGVKDREGSIEPFRTATIDTFAHEAGQWRLQVVTRDNNREAILGSVRFLGLVLASDPVDSATFHLTDEVVRPDPLDESDRRYDSHLINLPANKLILAQMEGDKGLSFYIETPSGLQINAEVLSNNESIQDLYYQSTQSGYHRLVVKKMKSMGYASQNRYKLTVWVGQDATEQRQLLLEEAQRQAEERRIAEEQRQEAARVRALEEQRQAEARADEARQDRQAREEREANRTLQAKRAFDVAIGAYRVMVIRIREAGSRIPVSLQNQYVNTEAKCFATALQLLNLKATHITDMIETLSNQFDKPYVSVGWARDYPDRMLLTVVWPTIQHACQVVFTPGAESTTAYLPREVNPAFLPDSAKVWNATTNELGFVLIKGFEQESTPPPSPQI
jgi:hypothetical protein